MLCGAYLLIHEKNIKLTQLATRRWNTRYLIFLLRGLNLLLKMYKSYFQKIKIFKSGKYNCLILKINRLNMTHVMYQS